MRNSGFAFRSFIAMLALGLTMMLTWREAAAQASASPQSSARSVLTVEGNGVAEAKPDYARLNVELLARAATIEGAVEASKTLVPRVDTLLQSLKPDGVETESSRFSIGESLPPHPAPNGSQGPASYTATTSYTLKLAKIDRLNAVISALASSGLLEMRQASFHVADEHVPMDEARRAAVGDAKRQADVLGEAAGVRLDDLASISDARAAPQGQVAYELPALARKYLQVVPPAKLDFSASIVMSWHISPKP
ncbi:MAG: SIMPL domain-containing protein [Hyphomicrobiales bacterium]|nr:SIMPL domain-containing protein [Hyphomicrobiales bacterium]